MRTVNVYSACIDCVALIENGEFNPDYSEGEQYEITRAIDKIRMINRHIYYTGHEIGFSWNCCNICERRSAGMRYQVEGVEQ